MLAVEAAATRCRIIELLHRFESTPLACAARPKARYEHVWPAWRRVATVLPSFSHAYGQSACQGFPPT
eukprot:365808-Chlamydomonas_euryale.AAC.30